MNAGERELKLPSHKTDRSRNTNGEEDDLSHSAGTGKGGDRIRRQTHYRRKGRNSHDKHTHPLGTIGTARLAKPAFESSWPARKWKRRTHLGRLGAARRYYRGR